ncbi:hypothetical protein HKCCE2091_06125 [Rhodobacterales bacterium HKCCE2091]|nr:hypothetical protein [Rhodobacterales bacterium HKCCE2091]
MIRAAAALTLIAALPASAQQGIEPWACYGSASFLADTIYPAVPEAYSDEDIRTMGAAAGLFLQVVLEAEGCPDDLDAFNATRRAEIAGAQDYFETTVTRGDDPEGTIAFFEQLVDICLLDIGIEEVNRLRADFRDNGPPCGLGAG